MRLTCIDCGKAVSTKVPDNCVVRAAIQCPECTENDNGTLTATKGMLDALTAENAKLREQQADDYRKSILAQGLIYGLEAERDSLREEVERQATALVDAGAVHLADEQSVQNAERVIAGLRAEVERLKGALDRDRTGLAHALAEVRKVADGYQWIPSGEWGCYDYTKQTCETLRAEVANCFDEVIATAEKALRESGTLATQTILGLAACAPEGKQP